MTPTTLDHRVALVTGGGVGIGRAVAQALAEAGACVAITWHSHRKEGEETLSLLTRGGAQALGFALDACRSDEVDALFSRVTSELGRLDILVNNAGGLVARRPIAEMTDEHWATVIALNLTSAFFCSRAAARHLADGGRIVNISSLAASSGGGAGSTAYAAAKAGMFGLTRGLAKELADRRITVNAVAPGLILETPFHEQFTPPETQRAMIDALPLGRPGTPSDVAAAVLWLCGEGASWVTGEIVNVNGGQQFV